jgi:hypothetical protein
MAGLARRYEQPEESKSQPAEKELTGSGFEKKIGKKYDTLLAERGKLLKELSEFNIRDYYIFEEERFRQLEEKYKLRDKWLKSVRQETDFLDITDRLGIEIFKDDLDVQPNFPNFKIIFGSKEIHEENIKEDKNIAGWAGRGTGPVSIGHFQSGLAHQMGNFLKEGRLLENVNTLVHELVHKYHTMHQYEINSYLTEAQAYFSGILSSTIGSVDVIGQLIQPIEEKGSYGFEKDPAIEAALTVSGLYALGVPANEIGDMIKKSEETDREEIKRLTKEKKHGNFFAITDYFNKLKKKYKINDIEQQALVDIYRLHASNQRLKAQLLLFQTIEKNVPLSERVPTQEMVSSTIATPDYKIKGKKINAFGLKQFVYYPNNKEFPYNSKGERHGIIFGFFPVDNKGWNYKIGRMEAGMDEATIKFADDQKEQDEYIEILKKNAKNISFESKEAFLGSLYDYNDPFPRKAGYDLRVRIIKTLFSQEDFDNYFNKNIFNNEISPIVADRIQINIMMSNRRLNVDKTFTFDDKQINEILKDFNTVAYLENSLGLADKDCRDYNNEFYSRISESEVDLMPLLYLVMKQLLSEVAKEEKSCGKSGKGKRIERIEHQTYRLYQVFLILNNKNIKAFENIKLRFDIFLSSKKKYGRQSILHLIDENDNGKKMLDVIKPLEDELRQLIQEYEKITGLAAVARGEILEKK